MVKKILTITLFIFLTAFVALLATGCGETKLASPRNLDIVERQENIDGETVTYHAFTWDKVEGAEGYLIYFNDDLGNRFFITENYLAMNDEAVSNYLVSGTKNVVNVCAVNLDKRRYPVNASLNSKILFNYTKKLQGAPTNLAAEDDGLLTWGSVREAKGYKAIVKEDAASVGREYPIKYNAGATGLSGRIEDLPEGEYLVSIVATAEGYEDSEPSKEIAYNNYSEENTVTWAITFDLGYEGAAAESAEAFNGRKMSAPAAPVRDGYEFIGWYEDGYLMVEADFSTLTITAPMTLYAKWEKLGGDPAGEGDPDTQPPTPPQPQEPEKCEYHFDADGDGMCDKCGEAVDEYDPGDPVVDWDGTITFDVTGVAQLEAYDEIYVYVWYTTTGGAFARNAEWPGVKVAKGADGKFSYKTDAMMSITGIVLSDGDGWQSADITAIPEDHFIKKEQIVGSRKPIYPPDWDGTVKVDISGVSWFENDGAKICIHVWYTDDTHNDWDIMTKGADGKYTVKLDGTKTVKGLVIARVDPNKQPGDEGYIWNQTVDVTDFSS
ncbi:MAG: InlB B-repeat-containing protein, partial [Clostridia bacterium]|nr:InlB B-repeat-containing protein [Clostridia bacterium]